MRRFYGFGSPEVVQSHIDTVATLDDLWQLRRDILASGTNLVRFRDGCEGVYAIDCFAGKVAFRHIFMTQAAIDRYGEPTRNEAFTVLRDADQ